MPSTSSECLVPFFQWRKGMPHKIKHRQNFATNQRQNMKIEPYKHDPCKPPKTSCIHGRQTRNLELGSLRRTKNETWPAKQTSNLYRTNVFNNEEIERIKRDTSLAHHMAPEKKAKPRLDLFYTICQTRRVKIQTLRGTWEYRKHKNKKHPQNWDL